LDFSFSLIIVGILLFILKNKNNKKNKTNSYNPQDRKQLYNSNKDNSNNDDCLCTMQYAPVCSINGITYSNSCSTNCKGIAIKKQGMC
jgi:hypothetical protein